MAREKETNSPSGQSVFEVNTVRDLIELMREHELTEIDLQQSEQRIRLRRGGQQINMLPAAPAAHLAAPTYAAPPAAAAPAEPAKSAEPEGKMILSPTIGTYYSSPKPGAPAFVNVGDVVNADTIVCIVEAMKMFNEIPAGISGKIVEVLAKDGEPVDNNRPLFRVLPN